MVSGEDAMNGGIKTVRRGIAGGAAVVVGVGATFVGLAGIDGAQAAKPRARVRVTITQDNAEMSGTVRSKRPKRCANNRTVWVWEQIGTRGGGDDIKSFQDTTSKQGTTYVWNTGTTGVEGFFYAKVGGQEGVQGRGHQSHDRGRPRRGLTAVRTSAPATSVAGVPDTTRLRALLALEAIRAESSASRPSGSARGSGSVSAPPALRAILREAEIPIESDAAARTVATGSAAGCGCRPLMLTTTEAMGLVMAVLEAHGSRGAVTTRWPAPSARWSGPSRSTWRVRWRRCREVAAPAYRPRPAPAGDDRGAGRRLGRPASLPDRLPPGPGRVRSIEVDPWAVVVRFGRWYVLGWSHVAGDRRIYRIDRVVAVEVLDEEFVPPDDLDPFAALEEQLSQGWEHAVDVVIDAAPGEVAQWLPRSLGHTEATEDGADPADRLDPQPCVVRQRARRAPVPFVVEGGAELRRRCATWGSGCSDPRQELPAPAP